MSDDYDPGLHFEVPTERCLFCGTEVTPGQLIGNTLANGAMPKMAEIAMRAMRAHTDELGALRKRVAELEACLPAAWLALTDAERDQLMALCCRHCGSPDTRCYCSRDD